MKQSQRPLKGGDQPRYHRFLWNRSGANLNFVVSGEPSGMSGPRVLVVINPQNILTR